MDIPNLSTNQEAPIKINDDSQVNKNKPNNKSIITIVIVVIAAIAAGFWISRFWPSQSTVSLSDMESGQTVGADAISPDALEVGVVYGEKEKAFKDSATGTLESGNINGEGTHILKREGGETQWAALISSTVDLDLFVDKKVEIEGETHSSTKANWLIDVGNIKIIE